MKTCPTCSATVAVLITNVATGDRFCHHCASRVCIICNGHLGHAPLVWKRIAVKKQEREMSDAELATWRSRAEGARVETPSGLVLQGKTAEVQKIVVNGADGKIDWKATAMAREVAARKAMGK